VFLLKRKSPEVVLWAFGIFGSGIEFVPVAFEFSAPSMEQNSD
jgi:hypothetical protein